MNSIMWNPWNLVVQDHRDGTIYPEETNYVREKLNLPVPQNPSFRKTRIRRIPCSSEGIEYSGSILKEHL